jgi:hypothetical protein
MALFISSKPDENIQPRLVGVRLKRRSCKCGMMAVTGGGLNGSVAFLAALVWFLLMRLRR